MDCNYTKCCKCGIKLPERHQFCSEICKRKFRYKLLKLNGGSHTKEEWEAKKKEFEYKCAKCGTPETESRLSKDHIIPVSRGGNSFISNIQPLCMPCNREKSKKIIIWNE